MTLVLTHVQSTPMIVTITETFDSDWLVAVHKYCSSEEEGETI